MQPEPRQRAAERTFRLRELTHRVGKNQIPTAAVNIERLAQILRAHRRAFNMPARPAWTPWAVPRGVSRFARFPQREIERRALALVDFNARSSLQLVDIFPGQLAVVRKSGDGIINVAVDPIGEFFGFELFDDVDDLGDMLRGERFDP